MKIGKKYLWIISFYLICLHLAAVILIVKTNAIPRVLAKAGLVEPAQQHIETRHRILQRGRDPIVPNGAAIFLGDSITDGFVTSLVEPISVNFGIGQQTTSQLIQSLPGYSSLSRAGAIYLMIGINDIYLGKSDQLEGQFQAIIDLLPDDVPLIFSGIMPAGGRYAEIKKANNSIRTLCESKDHCFYVDTFAELSNDSGWPAEGVMIDGTHPSSKGYAIWTSLLENARKSALEFNPNAD